MKKKERKTPVNKNQGWEPIHLKYKANENTSSRHNPKKKQKQTINKNHIKDPILKNNTPHLGTESPSPYPQSTYRGQTNSHIGRPVRVCFWVLYRVLALFRIRQ